VTPTLAFVTISYGPDRDRCALLCRSMREFAPSAEHWIVVDRADLELFKSLQDARTTLLTTEELLPVWLRRLNLRRVRLRSNMWLQTRGRPVRGWLVQQLIKLAVSEVMTQDVLVYADSDVALLRPFLADSVVDDAGRVRLYALTGAIDEQLPNHVSWHRSAEKLLGIEPAGLPLPDFITSLVPWKRENAVALLAHVQATNGRHWVRALAAANDVSEYTLYGRFVTDVLGEEGGQYVTPASLCHDYWTHVPLSDEELAAFLDGVGPDEVGVSITAKAGMQPAQYVEALERRWAAVRE
jgi:hypothetical protein